MTPDELLKAMFRAAVDAALPALCVPAHLPPRPKGRTVIIGAGKASGAMAKALEDAWDGPPATAIACRPSGWKWWKRRTLCLTRRAARPRGASSNWCKASPRMISCSA